MAINSGSLKNVEHHATTRSPRKEHMHHFALFLGGQVSETAPPSCLLSSRNGQLMLHGKVEIGFDGLHTWLMT